MNLSQNQAQQLNQQPKKRDLIMKRKWLYVVVSSLLVNGCGQSWQKHYEDIAEPVLQEYQEKAAKLTSDPSQYRFHFRLIFPKDGDKKGVITLHTYYPNGQADLTDEAKAMIREKVAPLKARADLSSQHINVVGHTDSAPIGGALRSKFENNQILSIARAKNVADYLKEYLGLNDKNISYEGKGADKPITSNATSEGKAKNRRVEVQTQTESVDKPTIQTITNPEEELKLTPIPNNYAPWWQSLVTDKMNPKSEQRTFSKIEEVLLRALKYSNQIRVFSDLPLIRKTVVDEANGAFDPHLFVEGKYFDIDKPTSTSLDTGTPNDRYKEQQTTVDVGVRKKFATGADISLSETLGKRNSNSKYFSPYDQAYADLTLSLKQPLLNGVGFEYNESQIAVAKIDHSISMDEFLRQISAHLLEVERAYWALYLERAHLLQKKKLYSEAEKVVAELEARKTVDAMTHQIALAKSELIARYAASIRSEQAVRNAEGKLISLINDPDLIAHEKFELVTADPPKMLKMPTDITKSASIALNRRPEIQQAFRQVKAGAIRSNMSKNELMPVLNFVVESSLHGLRGNYDVKGAYDDQFKPIFPNYTVGLMLDIPLGNRVAEARHRRRQIELRQMTDQLRVTVETVLLEVQVAVRELDTSYREMLSQYQAMLAYKTNLGFLEARRSVGLQSADQSRFLEQLLDAQKKLSESEQAFLQSYIAYNISHSNLDRATGLFLEARRISPQEEEDDKTKLPLMRLKQLEQAEPMYPEGLPQ